MTDAEIVTEGTGRHEQIADRAELDLEFAATGADRVSAVNELGRRIAAAAPALDRPGVIVLHRRLWVAPEWKRDRVVGSRASESIALRLDELDGLEDVLAALVQAEPAALHGPRWALVDPTAAQREAQRRAVADARGRAEGYATALGARLGALRRLSDAAEHPVAVPRMAHAEFAAADTANVRDLGLAPELVRVTARCTTTWELLR